MSTPAIAVFVGKSSSPGNYQTIGASAVKAGGIIIQVTSISPTAGTDLTSHFTSGIPDVE